MSPGRHRSLQDPETLQRIVEELREGIYIADADGKVLDANPACLEIFGVSSVEELRGFTTRDLFADPARRSEEMDPPARDRELVVRRPDGGERTVLGSCHRLADPQTGEPLFHGILIDISGRKQLESRFREQSLRDPLTGCYNRRFLAEVQKTLRPFDTWGAIVVDVDNFKDYNDEHGHQAGDEVLVKVSGFLQQNARAEDAVVRMGGDEFLLLLIGASVKFLAEVGQRLRTTAAEQGVPAFSVGWANRHGSESLERTIDHADRELLQIRMFERQSRQEPQREPSRGPRQPLLEQVLTE
jgi:diguanylate cyclase (GGDEF)-like protein/PAS domain S-box-containing protein